MKTPTKKKNYRLPEDLVFWMKNYCKHNGITETQLIVDSLTEFRGRAIERSKT